MPSPAKTFTSDHTVDKTDVSFVVEFKDADGAPVEHLFTARPNISFKQIKRFVGAQTDKSGAIVLDMEKVVRRQLVDDDGTPAAWVFFPDEVVQPGPDGEELTRAQAAKLDEFDAGSSRRRWDAVMADDELDLSINQMIQILEFLVEQAADERPTSRSSR